MSAKQSACKRFRDNHRHQRRCIYCLSPMTYSENKARRPSADHIVPFSLKQQHKGNMVLACTLCNSTRSNMTMDEWLGYMLRNIDQFPYLSRLLAGEQVLPGMESW